MRENKLMLTLTQRSLGAIPVSERRAAEMLKKVVVIAATVLFVSAVADVTLEGSGYAGNGSHMAGGMPHRLALSSWPRLSP